MIEFPPPISTENLLAALINPPSGELAAVLNDVHSHYKYWSDVKYQKPLPEGMTPTDFWTHVKAYRRQHRVMAWERYGITYALTNTMQRICRDIDLNFGGSWISAQPLPQHNEQFLFVNALMEEAIASSQMEGAATTRIVAKRMLREQQQPTERGARMIYNNYQTIRFLVEHKGEPLTPELLLTLHAMMTEGTLQNPDDAGRFRQDDTVVVEDGITHEVVHTPPPHTDISAFVDELCAYFNDTDNEPFVHPILRAIIVHFMVAYVHPFVDGNGRTARALFYAYLLRQGFDLIQYLPISLIIKRRKKDYENAFLYTEADGNDMGYFIQFHLEVLQQAFSDLRTYLQHQQEQQQQAAHLLHRGGLNPRQAQLLTLFAKNREEMFTVRDLSQRFGITPTTAKADLVKLIDQGLVREIPLNGVKRGYVRGEKFDSWYDEQRN